MSRHRKLTRKFAGFPMFKLATSGDTFPVTSPFTTGFTGLETDQLALDLQFAADKTLTARKGPTPVFVRGSGATFVDSDGSVKWSPENLVLQSEAFGTTWQSSQLNVTGTPAYLNVAAAPTGLTTADKLIANTTNSTHQFRQDVTLLAATIYTVSCHFKAAEHTTVSIAMVGSGTGGVDWSAFYNVSTGVKTGGVIGFSSSEITNAGNGWYRCSVTFTSVNSGATNVRFGGANTAGTNLFYIGNNSDGVLLWGAQLERSSTARTYNQTTSATFYGPRFDHDPITGICKGLLMEESRTNLVLQSENFATTWQVNGASITLNTVDSPDGVTADRFNEDATTGNHQLVQQVGSLTTGLPYTISVFAKAASHTTFQMTTSTAAFGSGLFANFILTGSGSVGASSGVTARIESYLNDWYRCSITINSVTGGTNGFVQIAANNNNSTIGRLVSYSGTNAQVVHLWGAQLEVGVFPTSYIPTTTGTLSRSADVCSITGGAFSGVFNPSQGTLFVNSTRLRPSGTDYTSIFQANDGTGSNRINIGNGGNPNDVEFVINRLGLTEYGGNVNNATLLRRGALAYSPTSTNRAYNGVLGTDDMSSIMPTVTQFVFGVGQIITAARYYQKRLPNSKLQTITV